MKLNDNAIVFYKDDNAEMLAKTTDLCFAAHQDDIEIMAYGPIAKCYRSEENWFTGVTITDGAGSPRSGIYENYTDEDMKKVRIVEQKNASIVGEYASQIMLGYPSSAVKSKDRTKVKEDIKEIFPSSSSLYLHPVTSIFVFNISRLRRPIRLPISCRCSFGEELKYAA